jgi:hypothetical protein
LSDLDNNLQNAIKEADEYLKEAETIEAEESEEEGRK